MSSITRVARVIAAVPLAAWDCRRRIQSTKRPDWITARRLKRARQASFSSARNRLIRDPAAKDDRRYAFSEQFRDNGPPPYRRYDQRAVRDERYKLILNLNHQTRFQNNVMTEDRFEYWKEWASLTDDPHASSRVSTYQDRPEAEFYDLESDPWEMHNLVEQAEHAEHIARLRKQIDDWMKQQGDDGHLEGEGIKYSDMPFAD